MFYICTPSTYLHTYRTIPAIEEFATGRNQKPKQQLTIIDFEVSAMNPICTRFPNFFADSVSGNRYVSPGEPI
jgi:hypothetical protein